MAASSRTVSPSMTPPAANRSPTCKVSANSTRWARWPGVPTGDPWRQTRQGVQIKVWDAVTGKRAYTLQGRIADRLAFSPDSRRLAAIDGQGTITIWEATPPRETAIYAEHAAVVYCVAFHPDNHLVASADSDQNIRIWDVATRKTVQTLVASTPSMKPGWPRGGALAFSGNGARLAAACFDGTVKVWDTKTWQVTADLKGLEGYCMFPTVAFAPTAASSPAPIAGKFASGKPPPGKRPSATTILSACPMTWPGVTGASSWPLSAWIRSTFGTPPRGSHSAIWGAICRASSTLAWSPDDRRLAFASYDHGHGIDLCDARSGRLLHRFANLPDMILKLCWSPDGRRLFSASQDGTVKVWDTEAFQELLTLRGQHKSTQAFISLALSPDGRVLIAAQGNRVYVWEAKPAPTEP